MLTKMLAEETAHIRTYMKSASYIYSVDHSRNSIYCINAQISQTHEKIIVALHSKFSTVYHM